MLERPTPDPGSAPVPDLPPERTHAHETAHRHAPACGSCAIPAEAPVPPPEGWRRAFVVEGLDCAEEVATLKRAVGPLVGGEEHLAFDVINGRMMLRAGAKEVPADTIREAVRRTGMTASEWRSDDADAAAADRRAAERRHRIQVWLMTLSGVATLAGVILHIVLAGGVGRALDLFAGHGGQAMPMPEIAAYALAIALGGRYVVVKAWYAARRLRPDMNLLMVIAVVGAAIIGEWFEAATVTFLFALSLVLESWSVGRARRAIAALLDLAPPTVRLKTATGEEVETPAAEVAVGSLFVVRPGERVALDGRVVAGESAINQAPITGESVPVPKEPGDEVFAGTINGDGALEIESTKAASDTTLARIIRLVEEAHGRRARAEQWVESFARVYTPLVILLAIAVFVVPPLVFGGAWDAWFYRALVLLVIACPCALVISTPVSIVAALASSARRGVLVKGGTYIEQPARLEAIAFDKTGTLTRGEPEVVAVVPLNGHTEDELLERAAALEARSTHPLASAITAHAAARGIAPPPVENARLLQGKGVTGRFDGEDFWLGSHRYLIERGQGTDELAARTETFERAGRTVIAIGNARHVCGLIAVADTVRPEARATVEALRRAGVRRLVMLTGDNRATGEAIGREVGVDAVEAELLPEDKVAAVERLAEEYGTVAMVGDGVNDAPAMARASFGIAMGAMGSDAAIETADIALMTDDLTRLPWLIKHSRRTIRIIRENIIFALGVKAIFVVLTFAGIATLWGAIAADVGASLLVVANALRLLRADETPGAGTA